MKWRAVLAAVLVLAILGIFLTTDFAKPFLGNFGEGLSSLTGGLTGFIFQPKPSGSGFEIKVTTSKEAFYGQKYKVSGATFTTGGIYSFLKVGDQIFESKSGKRLSIVVKEFSGTVEFTTAGSVILSGTSSYVELGDLISSSDKAMKVEIEIVPATAQLANFQQRSIHFSSISGRLERYVGDAYDSVNLANSKLDIGTFSGSLVFDQDGAKLQGTAFSAKGDNFSFV